MAFLHILAMLSWAIGAFLGGVAVRNAVKGFASRGWPQVQGCVLRSFVLVDRIDDNETFTPQVEYEYQVDGTAYRRMVLRYGRGGSVNRRQAERAIAPYPPGARVPVFFDPREHGAALAGHPGTPGPRPISGRY